MTSPTGDELAAYFTLRNAADRLQGAVSAQLREHDLTEVQFAVLARLGDAPSGLRMTDLAAALVASKSGLTYQVTQLERRGLLSRADNEADDRSRLVTLTDAGRAALARVLPGHVEVVRRLFYDRLTAGDLRAVRAALSLVLD